MAEGRGHDRKSPVESSATVAVLCNQAMFTPRCPAPRNLQPGISCPWSPSMSNEYESNESYRDMKPI